MKAKSKSSTVFHPFISSGGFLPETILRLNNQLRMDNRIIHDDEIASEEAANLILFL